MEKEIAIEELARYMGYTCRQKDSTFSCGEDCSKCDLSKEIAEEVIEKFFEKANGIRQNARKEILQELFEEASRYENETAEINTHEIREWAKHFGILLDE